MVRSGLQVSEQLGGESVVCIMTGGFELLRLLWKAGTSLWPILPWKLWEVADFLSLACTPLYLYATLLSPVKF